MKTTQIRTPARRAGDNTRADAARLLLLGGFELRDSAGSVVHLPTRKAQALLAYLALTPGRAHSRDALAALLWPEAPQRNARATLRQTLSLLNKALDPGVLEVSAQAAAVAALGLNVDVVEFITWTASHQEHDLARAAALHRGDFLVGLDIEAEPFEEWLSGERERLRQRMIDVFSRLAALRESQGDATGAVEIAQRLLAIDPTDEAGHRTLMRTFAAQGRRGAALRQYEVCENLLRRELDSEPGAQTRAVFESILRQREAPGALPGPAALQPGHPPAGPAHAAPLVGRAAALEAITTLLAQVRSSGAQTLAIAGEAGVGKSRLVAEIAAAAQSSFQVLVGHCHESQQHDPFIPWIELCRAAGMGQGHPVLAELEDPWRREIGRLLPELSDNGIRPDDDGQPAGPASRLFEALVRLLTALAARQPLLLVIEDVHWADDMSMRLAATVGRSLGRSPVLLIVTIREEEMAGMPSLQRALREIERHGSLTRLALAPLSRDDTLALLDSLAPATANTDARMADYVWASSEGNPFVVIETVHALRAGATTLAASVAATRVPFPQRVRDLIESHLERLGSVARRLADVAAVAGGANEFALLQRASGEPERAAAEALDELVRRRILRAAGERFEFTHERIRHVANELLLAPARRLHHIAIAETLEALHGADAAQVFDRLAYHYARTDRADKAVTFLTRLAERAARAGAHERAIEALDEALAHLARSHAPELAQRRFELVFRKSRSALLLGRLDEVARMLVAERGHVDAAADPLMAGPYYLRLGATFNYLGDYARSAESCSRALVEAQACGDLATMGRAHCILALHHFWAQPAHGVQHGNEAIALLERASDRWWLGQALWIHGLNLSYQGSLEEGLGMEARAALIGEETADRRLQCSAAWTDGFIRTLAGDFDGAVTACRRAVELAPDPMARMITQGMLALAYVERGEPQLAIPLLALAIPAAKSFGAARLEGLFRGFRGEAALQSGDLTLARQSADRGAALTRASGYVYGLGWTQRIQGRIARAEGLHDHACAFLAEAIATFEGMQAPQQAERTRRELARWQAKSGLVPQAGGSPRSSAR